MLLGFLFIAKRYTPASKHTVHVTHSASVARSVPAYSGGNDRRPPLTTSSCDACCRRGSLTLSIACTFPRPATPHPQREPTTAHTRLAHDRPISPRPDASHTHRLTAFTRAAHIATLMAAVRVHESAARRWLRRGWLCASNNHRPLHRQRQHCRERASRTP